jgi:hypothetical protein
MMAFFDLLKMGSYNHFPDSYAVNRKTLYQLFKPTLLEQLNRHKTVILSLHFPEEFFVVQDQLSQWNLDYQLITRTLDHQWFLENNSDASGLTPRLYLSLAEFLIETKFTGDELSETSLALMVIAILRLAKMNRLLNLQMVFRENLKSVTFYRLKMKW